MTRHTPIRHPRLGSLVACLYAAAMITAGSLPAEAQKLPRFGNKVVGTVFTHRSSAFLAGGWAVDLNGDGREELVQTFNNYPGGGPNVPEPIEVLQANSTKFAYSVATTQIVSGIRPELVHSRVYTDGDFNGDGRADLFLGGHGYDTAPFPGETDKILLSNNTGGQTGIIAPPGVNNFTHATASADINLDGYTDIFVGTLNSPGCYFLMGQSGAPPSVSTSRLPPAVAPTSFYTAAALVDVDGLNGPDLILGGGDGRANVVYLNDGNGSFVKDAPDIVLPAGLFGADNTITVDIAVADLNTDGRPDLLLSQTALSPVYNGGALQVLINTGSGFSDETSARLPPESGFGPDTNWVERIFLADFFGDGLVDIVISGKNFAGPTTPVIWLNDGTGVFTPQQRKFFDKRDKREDFTRIYPTDVNGDKRSDIVRVVTIGSDPTTTSYAVWTYLNKGVARARSAAPIIQRPPTGASLAAGQSLLLTVSAQGQRPIAFQWLKDGIAIPGATAPVYRVAAASIGDAGVYTVLMVAGKSKSTSLPVTVEVN